MLSSCKFARFNKSIGYIDTTEHVYIHDWQGNVRAVVHEGAGRAAILDQTTYYYPYGMPMAESTSPEANRYKYTAKELFTDSRLNLADHGARMYDPAIGRWISADPLSAKYTDISPYCFTGDNPIMFVDKNGLELTVVSEAALNILSHTLAPEDRAYLRMDSYGKVDGTLLNKGLSQSNSGSSNLESLATIVNHAESVVFYGAVESYQYLDSETNTIQTHEYEPTKLENEYQFMLSTYHGTPEQLKEYGKDLNSQGIFDETIITGNLGSTLQAPNTQAQHPTAKVSTTNSVEVYLNAKNMPLLELAKYAAHELYGHALFGIQGKDSRHSLKNNPTLENQIDKSVNEVIKNNL